MGCIDAIMYGVRGFSNSAILVLGLAGLVGMKGASQVGTHRYQVFPYAKGGEWFEVTNEKKSFCFLRALPTRDSLKFRSNAARIHQKIAQQNLPAIFSGNGKSCLCTP